MGRPTGDRFMGALFEGARLVAYPSRVVEDRWQALRAVREGQCQSALDPRRPRVAHSPSSIAQHRKLDPGSEVARLLNEADVL